MTSTKLSAETKNGTRYGFVNFTAPEEANQAIQATNNMQFGPCTLTALGSAPSRLRFML